MPTIKELLEVPFGPWEDSEVLNPKLKTTVLRTLELYELDMSCDDQPIGYGSDIMMGLIITHFWQPQREREVWRRCNPARPTCWHTHLLSRRF